MIAFSEHPGYSLVTAILPRQSTAKVLTGVLDSGARHAMTMNARGAVMQERWYQAFLPAVSPEQEMMFFIVPNEEVDHLMEEIVMIGKLRLYGAGSIFAMPCEEMIWAEDFPSWEPGEYTFESVNFDIKFKNDLSALIYMTDRDAAEPIAQAAMKAGAQGATITYMRGYGLRDRLGLLRITKRHDKELITVVVDEYDVEATLQAMSEEGHVDQPGRGLVYQMPISKGLTNLASVFQARKHSASIQQMVRAIDEMQGSTDWRANQLLVHDPTAEEFQRETRGVSRDLKVLNVIAHRKDTEVLLQRLLGYGVSGASVSNWRLTEREGELTKGGQRINREFACMTLLLTPDAVPGIRELLKSEIAEREMKETCFFTHRVPIARSFASIG